MTKPKKIFLIAFALFSVVLNIALYKWNQSLKVSEVPYLVNTPVDKIAFDGQGQVWVYGGGKLSVYKDSLLIQVFTEKDSPALGGIIEELEVDNKGRVWIGTQGRGLTTFDGKVWQTFTTNNSPLLNGDIRVIAFDQKGRAWIASGFGLQVIDGDNWENYTADNSDLLSNNVTCIVFDNQGRAWIGSEGSTQLSDIDIYGGFNIFDGKVWQTFTDKNSPVGKGEVLAIAFDQKGSAWIASRFGLKVIDGDIMDGDNWIRYPNTYRISDIAVDGLGRVWVNSDGGIVVFNGEIREYYFASINYAGIDIYFGNLENIDYWRSFFGMMATDGDGNIWIPTKKGVVDIPPDSPQPISYAAGILSIVITTNGLIYLTFLLLVVWLCIALNTWRSIGFSLFGFPIYLGWIILHNDLSYVSFWFFNAGSPNFYSNPGVIGTTAGIIGGCVDILLARSGRTKRTWWGLTGFVVGSGLSILFMLLRNLT